MLMKILAGIVGIVVANITFMLIQFASGKIFGVPEGLDTTDMAAMTNYIATLPVTALLLVLFGYALGCFLGGFVMYKIAKWDSSVLPIVLGTLGTIGWILNISMIPQPIWMVVAGFFCFIPFALIGYRLAKR